MLMILEILVERDVIDLLETMIEHLIFPRAEAGHRARRGAARGELEPVRRPAHDLGGFGGDAAIFRRGLGAGLPGAVHLVAKAPEFDVVRRSEEHTSELQSL